MRIGMMIGEGSGSAPGLDGLVARAQELEAKRFHTAWMANIFSLDAIGALGIVGRETKRIELGTAVVPTYPRHPVAMAQQALTAQAASGGRFTLGIGLSHQLVIEHLLGLSYARRASHMREYLEVLGPLLRGQPCDYKGEEYRVQVALQVPGATPVPVLVAALGPKMLELAARLAAGTITWMTGARTLAAHTVPTIANAARAAGAPAPRIVAGLPIALVRDATAARAKAAETFAVYGQLPSYRAMLDREGAAGPADVAIAGDERVLGDALRQLEEAGVTDFCAAVFEPEPGAGARTVEWLASRT
ncbi:MAG TPA: TIGR03564 family F420-dependent LLM class oxidoreductase [Myxococcota bacterium]|jgi:F420-dependent oxidoreductase-like protein|nr:TIGR03564 family F420-dependent LLM class oxidoreductase [Myxococcota bacterium]